ncbi:S26 family signal peptidase [Nocardia transvalensis]|uniref:S26 family signal peptidase n=1 Tax=Nocardia transvalensis TaxID=37333 RepID=UPI001893D076|nr:S26 family signal peptidase [Nocardia transvalensis]MBF6331717.1 hypothetical protein [Nocardia transvalensis]
MSESPHSPVILRPPVSGRKGERVPPRSLFLLGDNLNASFGSRHVGYFPIERVLGAVIHTLPSHVGPYGA